MKLELMIRKLFEIDKTNFIKPSIDFIWGKQQNF